MQLKDALQIMKFDTRLVDLYIKNGTINKEEYKKHLESLEDLSHLASKVSVGDSLDDEDDSEDNL